MKRQLFSGGQLQSNIAKNLSNFAQHFNYLFVKMRVPLHSCRPINHAIYWFALAAAVADDNRDGDALMVCWASH